MILSSSLFTRLPQVSSRPAALLGPQLCRVAPLLLLPGGPGLFPSRFSSLHLCPYLRKMMNLIDDDWVSTRAPGKHRPFFPDWPSDRKGYGEWRNQTRLDSPSAAMVPRGGRVEIAWSINSIRTIDLQHYVLTVFAWIFDGGHHIISSQ